MSRPLFNEPGCYAEGTFGHAHCRVILARLLERVESVLDLPLRRIAVLQRKLLDRPSDDFSEEQDAIELLNSFAKDGLAFEFVDGDLLLSEVEE